MQRASRFPRTANTEVQYRDYPRPRPSEHGHLTATSRLCREHHTRHCFSGSDEAAHPALFAYACDTAAFPRCQRVRSGSESALHSITCLPAPHASFRLLQFCQLYPGVKLLRRS
ncbi:hypothetical protein HPB50_029243 [Hyalomma asiaticum]|nr:hypothetical protein HPB50_029243 [Hyalomma asiaticum]